MLKFYKVDDSGKVQRLRKVCPQCGPGIFMATHFNRVYCGKCHLVSVCGGEGPCMFGAWFAPAWEGEGAARAGPRACRTRCMERARPQPHPVCTPSHAPPLQTYVYDKEGQTA